MTRAVSTVVDVALCLLLLSAAVGILLGASPPDESVDDRPHETATIVGTTTGEVEYESETGERIVRRGTLAELLAAAAVANTTIDGDGPLGNERFVAAVSEFVEHELDANAVGTDRYRDTRFQVRAVWLPRENCGVRGTVTAGAEPPDDVDVHVATFDIPVGTSEASVDRRPDGSGTGHNNNRTSPRERPDSAALANATVDLWFPRASKRPLAANRSAPMVQARYERTQSLLVDRSRRVDPVENTTVAERRIGNALADRYDRAENDGETPDPGVGAVELVIRVWKR